MIFTGLLVLTIVIFALQSILAKRLIFSALWLAGASALLSILFYLLEAPLVAVVELSVGAGLVTVLLVFAISIAGEDPSLLRPLVPRILGGLLALAAVLLIGWLSLPAEPAQPPLAEPPVATVIWNQRGLDILVQMVLIFAGVLGLLGLLAEVKAPLKYPVAEEYAQKRRHELDELQEQTQTEEMEKEPV